MRSENIYETFPNKQRNHPLMQVGKKKRKRNGGKNILNEGPDQQAATSCHSYAIPAERCFLKI